jgi:hypothetical protein
MTTASMAPAKREGTVTEIIFNSSGPQKSLAAGRPAQCPLVFVGRGFCPDAELPLGSSGNRQRGISHTEPSCLSEHAGQKPGGGPEGSPHNADLIPRFRSTLRFARATWTGGTACPTWAFGLGIVRKDP